MVELHKDTLAGKPILRGKVNHENEIIVFPPEIKFGEPPATAFDELVEGALAQMFRIAEHADPHVLHQAKVTEANLRRAMKFWMQRAAIAERARVRDQLRALGYTTPAEAIK
jgi:hypothetical protein